MRMQAHMGMNQQMQHVQNKQASPEIRQLPEEVVDTEKVNETEMNATRLTAAEMTKVLSQDHDPKYRQSEFFQFMSQIRDNEVEFAGNKVIDTPEKQDHISGVWDQPPPQAKQGVVPVKHIATLALSSEMYCRRKLLIYYASIACCGILEKGIFSHVETQEYVEAESFVAGAAK